MSFGRSTPGPTRAAKLRISSRSRSGKRGMNEAKPFAHRDGSAATDDPNGADCVREYHRPGWRRVRRELGASRGNATGFALFEYAGIAVVLERTGFPSDDIVEVRTQAIVAFLGRVAGPACIVEY